MKIGVETEIKIAIGVLLGRTAAGDGNAAGARCTKDIVHTDRTIGVAKPEKETVVRNLVGECDPRLNGHGGVVAQDARRQLKVLLGRRREGKLAVRISAADGQGVGTSRAGSPAYSRLAPPV